MYFQLAHVNVLLVLHELRTFTFIIDSCCTAGVSSVKSISAYIYQQNDAHTGLLSAYCTVVYLTLLPLE